MMDMMPFEYRPSSPTPLDPGELIVHGVAGYPGVAYEHMSGVLYEATKDLEIPEEYIALSEKELHRNHAHRMRQNTASMQRWRDIARGNDVMLTHDEAEGVMQLRSGTAKLFPAVELLSREPEMGSIEVFKSTLPYCIERYRDSIDLLMEMLVLLGKKGVQITQLEDRPYGMAIDEEHGTIITKTVVARAVVGNGPTLEAVRRDSFQLAPHGVFPERAEFITQKMGDQIIDRTPLAVSSYFRVK